MASERSLEFPDGARLFRSKLPGDKLASNGGARSARHPHQKNAAFPRYERESTIFTQPHLPSPYGATLPWVSRTWPTALSHYIWNRPSSKLTYGIVLGFWDVKVKPEKSHNF